MILLINKLGYVHGGVGIDLASRDRSGGSADYPDQLTRFSFGIGVFKLHII